jgi:hypothetical protein
MLFLLTLRAGFNPQYTVLVLSFQPLLSVSITLLNSAKRSDIFRINYLLCPNARSTRRIMLSIK